MKQPLQDRSQFPSTRITPTTIKSQQTDFVHVPLCLERYFVQNPAGSLYVYVIVAGLCSVTSEKNLWLSADLADILRLGSYWSICCRGNKMKITFISLTLSLLLIHLFSLLIQGLVIAFGFDPLRVQNRLSLDRWESELHNQMKA